MYAPVEIACGAEVVTVTVELTRTAEATGARSSQSWNGAVAIYGVRFDPRAFAARPNWVFTLEVASRPSVIEFFT